MDIVCFPGVLFDKAPWTNRQRIMLEFARRHRVFYVEPPKLPLLQAFKALARVMPEQRPWRWFGRLVHPELRAPGLWLLSQIAYVSERSVPGRRLNAVLNAKLLSRALRNHQVSQPIAWVYSPDAIAVIEELRLSRVVFDVVDDYPAQPYYARHFRGIEADQLRLARRAAVIFTSAHTMQRRFSSYNARCFLAGNAADFEHFSGARVDLVVPQDLEEVPRPRVGFVGSLDDYKVDVQLLTSIAARRPAWQFVLIGASGVAGRRSRTGGLGAMPNVHLLGPRSHAVLPAYVKGLDVCIIPYRLNRYTESCLPLKFFEFLAAGKPVVSTPLPELVPFASVARLAATAEQFEREVAAALLDESPEHRGPRLAVAKENTWEAKALRMERLVAEIVR